MRNDRASTNNGASSQCHPFQYDGAGADPAVLLNNNSTVAILILFTLIEQKPCYMYRMITAMNVDSRPKHNMIPNMDSPMCGFKYAPIPNLYMRADVQGIFGKLTTVPNANRFTT